MRYLVCVGVLALGCGPSVDVPGGDETGGATSGSTGGDAESTAPPTASSSTDPTVDPTATTSSGSGTDAETGSTTTGFAAGCFHSDVHGPQVASHPSGLVAYEGCDGGYLIEHAGDELIDTADGVNAVRDASPLFLGDPILSIGTGRCCGLEGPSCIALGVHAYEFSVEDFLELLADSFPEADGQCFALSVELRGFDGPRCEPEDPECLPIPVCEGGSTEACCDAPEYDPVAPRVPVDGYAEGPCTHDGECYLNGGGILCNSVSIPPSAGFAKCDETISQAFCGCVDDECTWFELG